MNIKETALQITVFAACVALIFGAIASDIIPCGRERFSLYESRDEALGEAKNSIIERFAGRKISSWKICKAKNVARQYVLEAAFEDSLQLEHANIRETRWGWRVQLRFPNQRFNDSECVAA